MTDCANYILENNFLQIVTDSSHGGRIVRFFDKRGGGEQLWYDASRLPVNPALDYDGNFAGGIDELLPCDLPEHGFPDHGELWTLPLKSAMKEQALTLEGVLPVSRLLYRRVMHLEGASLISEYTICNTGERPLDFLWKLHAALRIAPGDRLFAPAECEQAADPGDWSKRSDGMPRRWRDGYEMPPPDGSSDFFYLTGLTAGELRLRRRDGREFCCSFDAERFPSAWVFASFGRLNGSYTAILEPCSNYPLSLDDALRSRVCARLKPGEVIHTIVRWSVK